MLISLCSLWEGGGDWGAEMWGGAIMFVSHATGVMDVGAMEQQLSDAKGCPTLSTPWQQAPGSAGYPGCALCS